MVAREVERISDGLHRERVCGIGISFPGSVNTRTGEAINIVPFRCERPFPVRGKIENHLEVPVFIDNDTNVAAFGGKK